jgi:hypothetical protein
VFYCVPFCSFQFFFNSFLVPFSFFLVLNQRLIASGWSCFGQQGAHAAGGRLASAFAKRTAGQVVAPWSKIHEGKRHD